MRDVEHHERHVGLRQFDHLDDGSLVQVVGLLQGGRRGQHTEMVLAFCQQALEHHVVEFGTDPAALVRCFGSGPD